MATPPVPIIDAHIHLYPLKEVPTLAWATPDHPLAKQKSVDEYKAATGQLPDLKGYIFLETDRKNDLASGAKDASGWKGPFMEMSWIKRVALGQPRAGEGHSAEDAAACLAIIPWAPLPSGPEVMERYLALAEQEAGASWAKVRGFRYLVQDKPHGTMLTDEFIGSLKLLGRKGYVFDLGVDHHRRGRKQLDEMLEMIMMAHEDVPEEEKVTFIINHMCKPDLTIINLADRNFIAWRTAMYALSKCSNTYMKISGGFPEMTDTLRRRDPDAIFEAIHPWLGVVLATFGPGRMIFASDWPVCTVGVDEEDDGDDDDEDEDDEEEEEEDEDEDEEKKKGAAKNVAWTKWKAVVDRMCFMASLGESERSMLFGGTAVKAYGLKI